MHELGEMCIATYNDNIHWAKLANQGTPGIGVSYAEVHPTGTYLVFNPKTKKIILTRDVTFLQKSYGEYTKVEKSILLTISYEGLDSEEELEPIPIVNNNNNINLVGDSNSDDDIENDNNKLFEEDLDDKVNVTPKTTINAKVVHTRKKFQASYNDNANKIVKQATKGKSAIKNSNS